LRFRQTQGFFEMPAPLLMLALLAPAAQAPASASTPITVTGHPWAPFISPMGEPFRARTPTDDTLADWFNQADRNHDGVLTVDEMIADAERFFAKLDTDHDGEIGPEEIARYEYDIAPEIQVMSRTRPVAGQRIPVVKKPRTDDSADSDDPDDSLSRGRSRERQRERAGEVDSSLGIGGALQGAARYSLLNIPEPVASADTDFNRSITLEEFRQAAIARFQLLDSTHQGRLTLAQLEAMPHAPKQDGKRPKHNDNVADERIGNPLPSGP
jgi:Ca2+-binding EF-hand superfamily protein